MALKNIIKNSPLSSRDAATFNNTLQVLSPVGGIPGAPVLIRIINASDTTIGVSYDGSTLADAVRANSDLTLDFQANSQPGNFVAALRKFTNVYIIGAAAGNGFVYLAAYYQPEGY